MILVRVSVARPGTKLSFITLLTMVLRHHDDMKFLNAIKVPVSFPIELDSLCPCMTWSMKSEWFLSLQFIFDLPVLHSIKKSLQIYIFQSYGPWFHYHIFGDSLKYKKQLQLNVFNLGLFCFIFLGKETYQMSLFNTIVSWLRTMCALEFSRSHVRT